MNALLNNIYTQIVYLLSPKGFYEDTLKIAEDKWIQLRAMAIPATVVTLVAWLINLAGAWHPNIRLINIILIFVINFIVYIYATHPKVLGIISGFATLDLGFEKPLDNPKEYIKKWYMLISHIMVWFSTLLFILGTMPFNNWPFAIFILIAAFFLFALMDPCWDKKTKLAKTFAYAYVFCLVVMTFARLVPDAVWTKHFGASPFVIFEVTQAEKNAVGIKNSLRDAAVKKDADKLKEILKYVEDNEGKFKSPADKAFYEAQMKRMEEGATMKKIGRGIGNAAGAVKDEVGSWFDGVSGGQIVTVFERTFTDADTDQHGRIRAVDWSKIDAHKGDMVYIRGIIPDNAAGLKMVHDREWVPIDKMEGRKYPLVLNPKNGYLYIWMEKNKGIQAEVKIVREIYKKPRINLLMATR